MRALALVMLEIRRISVMKYRKEGLFYIIVCCMVSFLIISMYDVCAQDNIKTIPSSIDPPAEEKTVSMAIDSTIFGAVIGLSASILGALIGGYFSYRIFAKQAKENAQLATEQMKHQFRLSLLQMILTNNVHRGTIEGFIRNVERLSSSSKDTEFDELRKNLSDPALYFLFLLKPDAQMSKKLYTAIRERNVECVKHLTAQLLLVT